MLAEQVKNQKRKYILKHKDEEKLLKSILTYQQYRYLKSELDLNTRDKLMLELSWSLLLSSNQIKNLKESDFDEQTNRLKLPSGQEIELEDVELIRDIKECKRRWFYYIDDNYGRARTLKFKNSDYLIKPIDTGNRCKNKADDYLTDPSIALQKRINQQNITCPGYDDIGSLTIETIRRSKLIYLLSPQNRRYFNDEFILDIFKSCGQEHNLERYEQFANKKYAQ